MIPKLATVLGGRQRSKASEIPLKRVIEWLLSEWLEAQKPKDFWKANVTDLMRDSEGLNMLLLAKHLGLWGEQEETLMREVRKDLNDQKQFDHSVLSECAKSQSAIQQRPMTI